MSSFGAKDTTMHRFFTVFTFAALLLISTSALAQEQDAAAPHDQDWVQQKVETCATCHGDKGVSTTATFPTLAGQYESYLYHALKAYQTGDRKNAIMPAQVKGLTDAQLQALATYYSRQESPLYTPSLK